MNPVLPFWQLALRLLLLLLLQLLLLLLTSDR